eukprot:2579079-Rhodomonas_salina.2
MAVPDRAWAGTWVQLRFSSTQHRPLSPSSTPRSTIPSVSTTQQCTRSAIPGVSTGLVAPYPASVLHTAWQKP